MEILNAAFTIRFNGKYCNSVPDRPGVGQAASILLRFVEFGVA
jgi:hypothetical protein